MNHLLLDTHTLLWFLSNNDQIRKALPHIEKADHIYVSIASLWEIGIKIKLAKLDIDYLALTTEMSRIGFELLHIQVQHIQNTISLPFHHRDPFDRMLVAQSLSENIPLLTHDQTIAQYSDSVILF